MFDRAINLGKARLLLTNDDGIHAKGLKLLEKIARSLCKDVWVVAPETEQSGASHSLTLHRPLRVRQVSRQRYAIDGTPTDCVLIAINKLLADKRPTLVLSGINAGGNLGEDVTYSGTIAAAMEATLLEVPAIAFSMKFTDRQRIRWMTAERHAARVIRHLVKQPWPRDTLINVNFPDVSPDQVRGIAVSRQGRHKLGDKLTERKDPRGRAYFWIGSLRSKEGGGPGTDIEAIAEGRISVTPISLDLTNVRALAPLRRVFS